MWIGANDQETEDSFEWVDGTAITYSNWQTDEPDNDGTAQHCVIMVKEDGETKTWADVSCSAEPQHLFCRISV